MVIGHITWPLVQSQCSSACRDTQFCKRHLSPGPDNAPLCVSELKEPVGQIVCTDKGILAVEQNKVLVPPTWNKTFAWGYADLSCRLANYESDKVSPA